MNSHQANAESQWQAWAQDWAAASSAADLAAQLRRQAARQRSRLVATALVEGVLILALVVLTGAVLARGASTWQVVWLATLWGFGLLTLGFAYWNRRATWRAAGETVGDYLCLSRLRCERQRRTIRFALVLFAAQAIAIVAQLEWFGRLVAEALVLLAVFGMAVGIWSLVAHRRLARELERLDAFERELDEGTSP